MVVSEDRKFTIWCQAVPVCIMLLTFLLRFLRFYEVKGITERNGWAAPLHSHWIFLIAIIAFGAGTWIIKYSFIFLLVQECSLALMVYCEIIFMDFSGFDLSRAAYGFWLNLAAIIVLGIYCVCSYSIYRFRFNK